MVKIRVNGINYQLDVDPDTPLLWVLTEQLGLTGTKYSCGISECGSCTVHIDGEAELSCGISLGEVAGKDVVTIEGLKGRIADALRQAWIEEDVPQCGYCQSGQIMTAATLLKHNSDPSDDAIDGAMSDVLCRCGSYQGIRQAIHLAAGRKVS
ncbi:MAG: (2Fe-2S)-binding protein [Deltaproteobacteria bacterium]|nr:(2Fe-2S)-binding protein [Deltaproteobacteria bacterium]MBT4087309.1 (2Fe-2S)-binding protein [Deltaproteobacteria bacterium]MBT4267341.1 (2Fe-2S)-binding protein [Deltaproteobacteria bacterium]MBT7152324.1 (2Fe-2S)-binding protein [Deltaproteobacteria bacterium]MBT7713912.1 (2Fe-2S)-binding protein [Deltaproteobacteria bacterium]